MVDLNRVGDLQLALRDVLMIPTYLSNVASLRAKSVVYLLGGEIVTVKVTNTPKLYVWMPTETLADDGYSILKPDTVLTAEPGRWIMMGQQMQLCSAVYDPGSLADGAGVTTTIACTGVQLGDYVMASFSLDLQGILLTAYVSAVNVVSFRFQNETGGVLDLASGTLRALVMRQ